jgi:hypothetical protein
VLSTADLDYLFFHKHIDTILNVNLCSTITAHGLPSLTRCAHHAQCQHLSNGMLYIHIIPSADACCCLAPLQLQEDKDFHHWGVDFHSIYWRARHHGSMDIVRRPMVDFDPHTLRRVLPSAVRVVAEALQGGKRWARLATDSV